MDQRIMKTEVPTASASAPVSAESLVSATLKSEIKGLKKPLNEYKILQPKYALWPAAILLVSCHIFVFSYILSDEFEEKIGDDEDVPDSFRRFQSAVISTKAKFREIRNNFSAFKN